jgi:hypothetical protein
LVGTPLLLTEATRSALRAPLALAPLPPQHVKGHQLPVEVLGLADLPRCP